MSSEVDTADLLARIGTQNLYELLEVSPTANESELKRGYRRAALKYHPDKVGASDLVAREKFDLLQIANELLSDPTARAKYDALLRARAEQAARESAYDDRRKQLLADLERREKAGVAGVKRMWGDANGAANMNTEVDEMERKAKRLAEDGRRRRQEREEMLKRHAREKQEEQGQDEFAPPMQQSAEVEPVLPSISTTVPTMSDDDARTVRVKFRAQEDSDREQLITLLARFGTVEECVVKRKRIKAEGEKHRREYMTGLVVFENTEGARAAVLGVANLKLTQQDSVWSRFEEIICIGQTESVGEPTLHKQEPGTAGIVPKAPTAAATDGQKVPSFKSFMRPTKHRTSPAGADLVNPDGSRTREAELNRLREEMLQEEQMPA